MAQGYVLDGLRTSGDAVLDGLGDVMVQLAGVVLRSADAVSLAGIEDGLAAGGREVLRLALQLVLDTQAAAEPRRQAVTGADAITRTYAERGHARPVITESGEVRVRRLAYRTRGKGEPNLYPRDAVLNLPPGPYSWRLREMVVRLAREVSFETVQELVRAMTGITIGKRQIEEIITASAAGVPGFYASPVPGGPDGRHGDEPREQAGPEPEREPGEPGEQARLPLMLSADGKGVVMRPDSRRKTARAPDKKVRNFQTRAGIGEKGTRRSAQVGCVFDVIPCPRTPGEVMASHHGGQDPGTGSQVAGTPRKPAPQAVNRRYRVDIDADRRATTRWLFEEAQRRDPGHDRDWGVLVDGDNHQIRLIQAEAARRGITCPVIVIDLIHVLEYLWKAAWAFHQPRDPAIETWTITQALDILHGRAAQVAARIAQLAEDHPPAGPEHARNISKTLSYLQAKQPYLDYPAALAAGWPVATGVIEGACRHLIKDRMDITGARWSTHGAQAILWLRVIRANNDHDTYWQHHINQEHQRNHLSRYADNHALAA